MIQETLKKVAAGQNLTYDEAYASMDEIFSGQVPGDNSQCKWNERPCGVSST